MNKILKLFINENIKTWKKFSTKLMLIFIIVTLLGTLALVKIMKTTTIYDEQLISDAWKENIQDEIDIYEEQLKDETLDNENRKLIEDLIKIKQLHLELNIYPYSDSWKSRILQSLTIIGDDNEKQKLIDLVKNGEYSDYIQMQKDDKKEQLKLGQISQEEYNDEILLLDLTQKYGINENTDNRNRDWRDAVISEIRTMQRSLRTGIDYTTYKVLSSEQKAKLEDEIQMNIYRIGNNIKPVNGINDDYRVMFESLAPSAVITMIAVSAIIIAGSAISQEVSTGTIKFWALTPNKRWKILTAKILSVIFYIVIITIIMSILNIVIANVFFDTEGIQYIYVNDDGEVRAIGNALYIIGTYFAKAIPVVVFSIFAIMLSTITRSSSVALSLGITTYIGNGIVMAIINQFIKKDWIRFVPFNNLNIADKIFVNAENPMTLFGQTYATSSSLAFSLCVLGVCCVLMLVTMFDSFNKRDII